MMLVSAHATNYRNVINSNPVTIGASTCLVGKNEAGKTAFLKALEGLRSTNPEFKEYGKTENYPRRFLADYETRHPNGDAVVMRTQWEMSEDDAAALEAELGEGVVTDRTVEIWKEYGSEKTYWAVPIDEEKVLDGLVKRFSLDKEERSALAGAKSTKRAAEVLEAAVSRTERQNELLTAIKKFRDGSARSQALDILNARTPKFLYFSHYDRMSGALSINKLNEDKSHGRPLKSGDRVFLDFLEYAGTTIDELASLDRFEELNAKCEAAALRITQQIFDYWT